jgi:integrase
MARRGNSEGNIRKRADGRWEARIVLADGARKSLYGQTRQDVARLLAEAIRAREAGLPVQASRQTVAEYLATWLASVKHKVKRTSYIRYEQVVRLHLIPGLGTVALAKLTAQQVQVFYAKQLDAGATLSGVRVMHILLHAALDAAVRLDLVQRNVTDLVDKPKYRNRVMQVLTEGQARTLLATVAGERLEALCVLALATAMRQGELFALKWADVDLDGGWLQVRASIRRFRGEGSFRSPRVQAGVVVSRSPLLLRWHYVGIARAKRRSAVDSAMPGRTSIW